MTSPTLIVITFSSFVRQCRRALLTSLQQVTRLAFIHVVFICVFLTANLDLLVLLCGCDVQASQRS